MKLIVLLSIFVSAQAAFALDPAQVQGRWNVEFSDYGCGEEYFSGGEYDFLENSQCNSSFGYACSWEISDEKFVMRWTDYPDYALEGYYDSDSLRGSVTNPNGEKQCWRATRVTM